MRTAEEIRAALDAPDFGSIKVWRASPGGPVVRDAKEAAESPVYVAAFGQAEFSVSPFEHERLLEAGVTDVKDPPAPTG